MIRHRVQQPCIHLQQPCIYEMDAAGEGRYGGEGVTLQAGFFRMLTCECSSVGLAEHDPRLHSIQSPMAWPQSVVARL